MWWWLFCSSRSARGCATDSGDRKSICCDSGRWISGNLGQSIAWWWQFSCSRSAQGCARFRRQRAHSLRFWQMVQWLPGAIMRLVVTVLRFKISSGVFSRFRPQMAHLLRFWRMVQWLAGAMNIVVVTVLQFKISSGACSRFRRQKEHLLRFWQMVQWLAGAMNIVVVTVLLFKISSGVCNRFRRQRTHSLQFWQMVQWLLGAMVGVIGVVVTVLQFKISSGVCSRFRRQGGPLLPPPAPRRARRPPGPVLTKVQGAKGGKTYRAFSGLLHQDVLGALGLCADNSTGCELEKHVRRLVGSLPWGFAVSILQTKWSCVSKIDSITSLQGSCLAHCCSVSLLSWSPKLASSRLAFRLSNTGFAKSIHIYNAVLCGLAP